jgi:hypothetical protein
VRSYANGIIIGDQRVRRHRRIQKAINFRLGVEASCSSTTKGFRIAHDQRFTATTNLQSLFVPATDRRDVLRHRGNERHRGISGRSTTGTWRNFSRARK